MKLPAMMFYTGDWMKDPAIRACGLAARGLWFDMLCLMHESPQRGRLVHRSGMAVTPGQLSRMVGGELRMVEELLTELEATGVYSIDDGAIVCRRMLIDEDNREKKRKAGRAGAKSRWQTDGKGYGKDDGKPMAGGMTPLEYENAIESENAYTTTLLKKEIAEVMEAIPRNRRRKPAKSRKAIGLAVMRLEGTGKSAEDATAYLVERVAAYYGSPEGKGEYHREPPAWFDGEGYDEDDSAWQGREPIKAVGWGVVDEASD